MTLCVNLHAQEIKPRIAVSTSILGDVVHQIAGDAVELIIMIPPGSDPHYFEPSARQLANLSNADLIFINGIGLETFMESFLSRLGKNKSHATRIVETSENIPLLAASENHTCTDDKHHDREHDPHVWTNPRNVMTWADNIAAALCILMPEKAASFRAHAESYKHQLESLDGWISEQTKFIPAEKRLLVTDHHMLGYFAERYGFEQAGMILPSFSTAAEPSAREIAELNTVMREKNIGAIFIGMSANPVMAERIAHDTGARVERLYSGSLGGPGSGVESYFDYMKHNVSIIVNALR